MNEGDVELGTLKELRNGRLVIIDGEPCKVVNLELSKSGKHGSSKARLEAISLFSGSKKTILKPADSTVEIPILKRETAQVVALMGDKMQLMDLQSYETFEADVPAEFKDKIVQGCELDVQNVMGKRLITRVKEK